METCTSCPAPNDDKSLSFDYTPTFAEASDGMQDRFGAGQAGQGRPIRLRSGQAHSASLKAGFDAESIGGTSLRRLT